MAFWAVVAGLIGAKIIHGAVRNARNEVREEWEDRVARAANKILAANGQDYDQAIGHTEAEIVSFTEAVRDAREAKDRVTAANYGEQLRVLRAVRDGLKRQQLESTEQY